MSKKARERFDLYEIQENEAFGWDHLDFCFGVSSSDARNRYFRMNGGREQCLSAAECFEDPSLYRIRASKIYVAGCRITIESLENKVSKKSKNAPPPHENQ